MSDFPGVKVVEIGKGRYQVGSVTGNHEVDVATAAKRLHQLVETEVKSAVAGLSFLSTVIGTFSEREDDFTAYDLKGLAAILGILSERLDDEARDSVGDMAVVSHFCQPG